jgi:hypothetical protein
MTTPDRFTICKTVRGCRASNMNQGERQSGPGAWRRTLFKQRFILFTHKDEAMFSEALCDRYPSTVFVVDRTVSEPEELEPKRALPDLDGDRALIVVPPSSEWRPEIHFSNRTATQWIISNLPKHSVFGYSRSKWDWAFFGSPRISYDPPTLNPGDIRGAYQPADAGHKEFLSLVRHVWKIIEGLATSRYKHGHPLGNELSGGDFLLMKDAKPGYAWLGHHALEWCQSQPRRMLGGSWRACDDWEVPQNDWYQSLRRRVEEKYGPDIGNPPPRAA